MPLAETRLRPALAFGLRCAASVMLALLVAFSLQLDQPGWAGTSALIVAQPVLGATLRKGVLRLIGTLLGAAAAVALVAAFPQDRWGFFLALSLWGGACSAIATVLGELLAYAPLLAGYTCAIIATAALADPPNVLLLAVARGACIAIGIVSTSLVFGLTDRGRQRAVLAAAIRSASEQALAGLLAALRTPDPDLPAGRAARRGLVARVSGFDSLIDQAAGETLELRARAGMLRQAVAGLLVILSAWRGAEQHMAQNAADGAPVARLLQDELAAAGDDPLRLRAAAARVDAAEAADASRRLLLDRCVSALTGLADVRAGQAMLASGLGRPPEPGMRPTRLRHAMTATVNGLRSFATVAAASALWVASGWTSGGSVVIFAMVIVLLFGVRQDSYRGAVTMSVAAGLAVVLAALIKFCMIPWAQGQGFDDFLSLCVVLGGPVTLLGAATVLLPPGSIGSILTLTAMSLSIAVLSPTNEITYDFAGFLDGGLAIVVGSTLGAAAHRLIPPLPHRLQVRLLLRQARGDLRRIVAGRWWPSLPAWEARQYARAVSMPADAALLDHGRLLAALSVGRELLRRHAQPQMDAVRRAASEAQIAEAVASHPDYFAGLGLAPRG